MKNCIEIDDGIIIPQPWADVVANSGKLQGERTKNGAFKMQASLKPVVERLVQANILPPIMNPASMYESTGPYSILKHQRWMIELYTAHTAAYNLADMGCVDKETEFLTPHGWKKISEYQDGDKVAVGLFSEGGATRHWKCRQDEVMTGYGIHFEVPKRYVNASMEGDYWVTIKNDIVDQKLSSGHRIPIDVSVYETGDEWIEFSKSLPSAHQPARSDGVVSRMMKHARFITAGDLLTQCIVQRNAAMNHNLGWITGVFEEFVPAQSVGQGNMLVADAPMEIEACSFESVGPERGERKYCFTTSTGLWFMRRNGRVALTGNSQKTASTLWAFDFLRKLGKVDRLLVAAPLSTLEAAWLRDVGNTVPHLRAGMLIGSKKARLKQITEDHLDIVVINHDGLKIIERELVNWCKKHKVMFAYDEATAIADYATARAKTAMHIANVSARRYVLTATPVVQHLMKAHGLMAFVNNNPAIPRTKTAFRHEFFVPDGPHRWVPKLSSADRLQKLMWPAIRLNTRDVVDLPPNVVLHRWPPLTKDQEHAYDQMEETLVYEHNPTTIITAANAAVQLGKLLQITCGMVNGENGPVSIPPTHKYEELLAVIDESQSKVLIFSPYTASIDAIVAYLEEKFEPGCVEIIDGRVDAKKRGPIMARFQNPDDPLQFIVAHPVAASHGITLTSADTCVWFAPFLRAESFVQANQRIDRPGQTRHTRTVLLASTPMERKLYESLLDKKASNQAFVDVYDRFIIEKAQAMAKKEHKK